ncbi:MAG: aldo/keto reductase, partial [Gemmatimonadetes bacterium]|nr:aldo/keto reductase [Gemmatimonadota bacterium]
MKVNERQSVGKLGLEVTRMGFGGAPLGNLFEAIPEEDVADCLAAAYGAGVRYFDTAPLYGFGLSESRYGDHLAPRRDEIVLSTKVGYSLVPRESGDPEDGFFVDHPPLKSEFDFSADAVRRSLDESLGRLRTDRIDIVYIHDPDEGISLQPDFDPYGVSHFREAMEQTYPVLDELRSQGVIKAVGAGMNQWQVLADFARAGDFDCFLLAGRYTLLEQTSLEGLLPPCGEKGEGVGIGGPYNSG